MIADVPGGRTEMTRTFSFTATLWEHDGPGAWHFVSLPHEVADAIVDVSEGRTGGFGSVRVEVTIGNSTWHTSLFPDARRGTYVLPVKKAVRSAEALGAGADAAVRLLVVDRGADGGHDAEAPPR